VRGLGETVEKQMVENHHLLRNGEGLAESIDFPRFYSDLLSALKGEGFLWVVHLVSSSIWVYICHLGAVGVARDPPGAHHPGLQKIKILEGL